MGGNSLNERNGGNATTGVGDREAARIGEDRLPSDIPKQGSGSRLGFKFIDASAGSFRPSTTETGGHYFIGPAHRPPFGFDAGFSTYAPRAPTPTDYAYLAKWRAMLEGAEALRPDLSDASPHTATFLAGAARRGSSAMTDTLQQMRPVV